MNSRAPRFAIRASVVLLFCVLSIPLRAQVSGAVLSGTVTDPAGKAVSGARVTARNIATGQLTEARTDSAGFYEAPGLATGDYEVSVAAEGFGNTSAKVTIATSGRQTMNLTLRGMLSLEDLGLHLAQAQGSEQDQAKLDKRSHMLQLHQRYGLIATLPLLATVITGGNASGKSSTSSDRNLHAALGLTSVTLYSISAYYAIAAPRIEGIQTHGNIRLHKALAWVHGAGMILTPILGGLAYQQRRDGESVHGVASAHGAVGIVTIAAYGAAILTEIFK